MEHFTLGRNNGLRASRLALGAGNFGTRWGYGAEEPAVRAIVDRFAEAGGTFIDTAASYQVGESEEILGRVLAGRRDEFTLATKFAVGGTPEGSGVLQAGNGRRAMFRSVEHSLRRLDTDYVDLLWVHWPDFVTPIEEIVRAFDDLISSGKVLYAGLSNFPAWLTARGVTLAELRGWAPLAAIQIEYSLVVRDADRENLPMAEALGIGAALWSPLGGGLLTGKYRSGGTGRLTEWDRVVHREDGPAKAAIVDAVLAAADDLGVPAARVAVAWLVERARRSPTGVMPIIGPRTLEQVDDYLAALELDLGAHYDQLDEVSRTPLGQPYDNITEQQSAALGTNDFRLRPFLAG